jgi:preprotein translocase subunit SecF
MFEIVKNPNVNWLGLKKPLILVSITLLLAGAVSVFLRGFNMGIDFAGGTLVTVKFKGTRPTEAQIRDALDKQGIDKDKVVVQPISDPITGGQNQVLIRLPQREQAMAQPNPAATSEQPSPEETGSLGIEKETILKALMTFNPSAETANKEDLNTIGRGRLQEKFVEFDLLGLVAQSGQATAISEYGRYADQIVEYRDKQSGGLLNQTGDLKNVSGLPSRLIDGLPSKFYLGNAVMIGADVVGPHISKELQERAIYVTLASFVGILLYMAFRFEWIYGVAAVVAVFHDVLVTLGIFSILQKEISLNVVAALLTLVGYSVNDTIVIFDRVRENLRLRRREGLTALVNDSLNQTLSRTILTSGLTFLAVFCLWWFGGPVLEGFSFALVIGIIVGSYSTLAIASPIMVWWQERQAMKARSQHRGLVGRQAGEVKRKVAAN